jgi:hypothetical protein
VTVKKPVNAAAPRNAASRKAPPAHASKAALCEPVPLTGDALDAAILRHLRTKPNQALDLAPLATELEVDPTVMQLAVERLHNRRMVVAPFIEPGRAGGAELTAVGLRWLIAREGGKPQDTPVAFQPAKGRVRAQDEAARLPRAQVYGVRRQP